MTRPADMTDAQLAAAWCRLAKDLRAHPRRAQVILPIMEACEDERLKRGLVNQ